jgi:MFS family permease
VETSANPNTRNALNILPSYTDYFTLTTATLALNTAGIFLGGAISSLFAGKFADYFGRKNTMYAGAAITLFAAVLQTAAQNFEMFVVARIFIGAGFTVAHVSAVIYAAETLPLKWRGWGLGLIGNLFYVG